MDEKRLSIRFRLDDEIDREIWEYLMAYPKGSRQNAIKIALLHELKGSNDFGAIRKTIEDTIRESLKGIAVSKEPVFQEEIPKDVFDFLGTL